MNQNFLTRHLLQIPLVFLASIAIPIAIVHASLVGDQIFVDRVNPSRVPPFSFCQEVLGCGPAGCPITVADGESDRLALTNGNNLYVNVDAFQIRFELGPELGGGGPFDEHLVVFRDLDFLGTNHVISGVTFDTDLVGMDASRITFTDHGVTVNYANISYPGGQYLILTLQTSPVPEASAFISTILAACALVSFHRRRDMA